MSRQIDPRGYVRLFGKVYHPRGWMFEHRYVMEQHLKRRLSPKEVVHHINRDKTDNRIENLCLTSASRNTKARNAAYHPNTTNGRWAEHYDHCIECGRVERPHAAKGLCFRCYAKRWGRNNRLKQGSIPVSVRRQSWAVDYDGNVYQHCRDCGRTDAHHCAHGLCDACTRWRNAHGGQPRTAPIEPRLYRRRGYVAPAVAPVCKDCGHPRVVARELCGACYKWHSNHDGEEKPRPREFRPYRRKS